MAIWSVAYGGKCDVRNMSFTMTTEQFVAETKDVTRRMSWWFLKPGDIVMGVRKCMGLKKGEKIERFHPIRIVSVRKEPLSAITKDDVIREGFPDWTAAQFVMMICKHYGCRPQQMINRIEFEHLKEV